MGSDDIFKRKKRAAKTRQARLAGKRSPYETVLIVTEGEKTEPKYFQELISAYRLNTANINIDGSSSSSPKSVFEHAKKVANESRLKGAPYDRVYCIFDKDTHACYFDTMNKIEKENGFYCVASVPCFEFWFILHYIYTTASIVATGNHSCGANTVRELKKYIPNYEKGDKGTFNLLKPQIQFAIENSKRALKESQRSGNDNPSTNVHELVEFLINLKGN